MNFTAVYGGAQVSDCKQGITGKNDCLHREYKKIKAYKRKGNTHADTHTHTSHAHGEYQSVIWDYSSTEGRHFQHFKLCGNTQNAQKRQEKKTKHKSEP